MINNTYIGDVYSDKFVFQFGHYGRELVHNTTFLGITDSSVKFKSDYSGFLGIQPYAALLESGGIEAMKDMEHKDTSFLLTLQKDNIIDNLIVSLFVNYQTGNSTI